MKASKFPNAQKAFILKPFFVAMLVSSSVDGDQTERNAHCAVDHLAFPFRLNVAQVNH
jgi:hypothetical protein